MTVSLASCLSFPIQNSVMWWHSGLFSWMALFFITLRNTPLLTNSFVGPPVPRNCPHIEYNLPEMTEILSSVFPDRKFPGSFGSFLDTRCPTVGFLPAGNLCDPEVGLLNSTFENLFRLWKSIVCSSDQGFYKSCRRLQSLLRFHSNLILFYTSNFSFESILHSLIKSSWSSKPNLWRCFVLLNS